MSAQTANQEIDPQEALNALDAIAQRVNSTRDGHLKLAAMVAKLQELVDANQAKSTNAKPKSK